jgi:AraC family transcriptional regulator of adaptative response/methylated-DNA-[protein]-cysteine methyltransferase
MIPVETNMTITHDYSTDDERWNAVRERDGRADGAFLYAVKTTGVFCRPTCPSRLPNRANVEFFTTCELAVRGGYRACRKCKPTSAPKGVPDAVLRACRLMDGAGEPPSLEALAGAVGLSPFYFHKLFKAVVGVTPKAYAAARRVERFRDGLEAEQTVTQAMYGAGFGSSSRCYEGVGDNLGMTPTEYRGGGAGKSIRLAVVGCRLGWVAVAATERGVCLIEFGNSPDALRAGATARFPKAAVDGGDPEFRRWVEQVVEQIEAPGHVADLPLDIQGTAFQRKVWEALRAIPAGTTATYKEIAQRIGRPAAVRAVARACAANPLAVAIPCHRVVRSDGDLGGYRWGVGRKAELLRREGEGQGGAGRPGGG